MWMDGHCESLHNYSIVQMLPFSKSLLGLQARYVFSKVILFDKKRQVSCLFKNFIHAQLFSRLIPCKRHFLLFDYLCTFEDSSSLM